MSRNKIILLAGVGAVIAWLALPSPPTEEDVAHFEAGVGISGDRDADVLEGRRGREAAARADRGPAEPLRDAAAGDVVDDATETRRRAEARWDPPPVTRRDRQRPAAPDAGAVQLQIDSAVPAELAAPELEQARALARQAAVAPTPELAAPVVPVEPDGTAPEVLYDSGDDMQFRSEEQVEVERPGKIVGASGTIAFDLSPQWDESVGYADFVALGDNVRVTKLADYLQFEIIDAGGARHVVSTKVNEWEPQQAQEIAATWDERQLHLYVNGIRVAADALEHPIQIADDAALRIGSRYPDGRPIAAATISRVRLRDELFVPPAPADALDGP